MRIAKFSALILTTIIAMVLTGCVSQDQFKDLRVQNETQQRRISELNSELQATRLELEQNRRQLAQAQATGSTEVTSLQQKVAALEMDLAQKLELIQAMQQRLMYGGAELPVELSTKLADFARGSDMISYDQATGVIKFKSDLLFERGSAVVAGSAKDSISALAEIMNSEDGSDFDLVIAGHTDDMRIARAETKAKHPTNWHLSAHRAISVLEMLGNKIESERMSIRGFGEFRPVEENKPNRQGNPQNRRVEIFVVPRGA